MENEKIELRSPKVRQIIGQVPPFLIRAGISLIFFIVIFLLIGSKYFTIPYIVEAKADILQENKQIDINIWVPSSQLTQIKNGQKVSILLDSLNELYQDKVQGIIDSAGKITIIENNKAYTKVYAHFGGKIQTQKGLIISQTDKIYHFKAQIQAGEISFFDKIFGFLIAK